jgi:hypothetical protein
MLNFHLMLDNELAGRPLSHRSRIMAWEPDVMSLSVSIPLYRREDDLTSRFPGEGRLANQRRHTPGVERRAGVKY